MGTLNPQGLFFKVGGHEEKPFAHICKHIIIFLYIFLNIILYIYVDLQYKKAISQSLKILLNLSNLVNQNVDQNLAKYSKLKIKL